MEPRRILHEYPVGENERYGILDLCHFLWRYQRMKGDTYGNSWEKRGEMGVLHNIFRKIDRIENIVTSNMVTGSFPSGDNESLTATIADLAVYSLLWLDRMRDVDPQFSSTITKMEAEVVEWERCHLAQLPAVVQD